MVKKNFAGVDQLQQLSRPFFWKHFEMFAHFMIPLFQNILENLKIAFVC